MNTYYNFDKFSAQKYWIQSLIVDLELGIFFFIKLFVEKNIMFKFVD